MGVSSEQAKAAALGDLTQLGKSEEDVRWTVTGKLVKDEGDVYIMTNLHEITEKPALITEPTGQTADALVNNFSSQKVLITFADSTRFTFESAQGTDEVTNYFGGNYSKK
jgi:hypothetical protein